MFHRYCKCSTVIVIAWKTMLFTVITLSELFSPGLDWSYYSTCKVLGKVLLDVVADEDWLWFVSQILYCGCFISRFTLRIIASLIRIASQCNSRIDHRQLWIKIILQRDTWLSFSSYDIILTRQRKKMHCDASDISYVILWRMRHLSYNFSIAADTCGNFKVFLHLQEPPTLVSKPRNNI